MITICSVHSFHRGRRAITLLELLLGITITVIIFAAVAGLLVAAANTNRYLVSSSTTAAEVDLAVSRLTHNLRTASEIDGPTDTNPATTLSLLTQPDPGNGLETYAIDYRLEGNQLLEVDPRFGTNTILNNVSTFSVQLLSMTSPQLVQITVVAGTDTKVTRSFKIYCRNL